MRHLAYYNTDELEAELRAIGVHFNHATSDYEKKKLIEDWWKDGMNNFGETQEPAAANRQRTDIYIYIYMVFNMNISMVWLVFTLFLLMRYWSWTKLTVDRMKSRLMAANQSFNSKATKKELFDLLIGLKVMERRRTGGPRNGPMSEGS